MSKAWPNIERPVCDISNVDAQPPNIARDVVIRLVIPLVPYSVCVNSVGSVGLCDKYILV